MKSIAYLVGDALADATLRWMPENTNPTMR